jgi:hypothetical protein
MSKWVLKVGGPHVFEGGLMHPRGVLLYASRDADASGFRQDLEPRPNIVSVAFERSTCTVTNGEITSSIRRLGYPPITVADYRTSRFASVAGGLFVMLCHPKRRGGGAIPANAEELVAAYGGNPRDPRAKSRSIEAKRTAEQHSVSYLD